MIKEQYPDEILEAHEVVKAAGIILKDLLDHPVVQSPNDTNKFSNRNLHLLVISVLRLFELFMIDTNKSTKDQILTQRDLGFQIVDGFRNLGDSNEHN